MPIPVAHLPSTNSRPQGWVGNAVIMAIFLGLTLVLWVHLRTRDEALGDALAKGQQQLGLYAATIRNALDRYSYLPATIALDGEIIDLLKPGGEDGVDAVNRKLEAINAKARSASLYIMNARGITVASSNWNTPTSYVGNDYSVRPYFRDAMKSGEGHFFGIGMTTKLPGYFLASAIRDEAGTILGTVVVKIDLETLEGDWGQSDDAVMVSDEDGVVILTNRPSWKYTLDGALTAELKARLESIHRYGAVDIHPLPRTRLSAMAGAAEMERIDGVTYVVQAQGVKEEGWTIRYYINWDAIEVHSQTVVALVAIGWVALILLVLYGRQRRIALKANLQAREAVADALLRARDQLEEVVAQRTQALSAEIAERQRTEMDLRKTQDELIHAGRMAALGQMSAAMAHELNQPLAAIQTFIASSRIFLERNELETVGGNLGRIDDLAKRMADLVRHLKVFARKTPAGAVPIDPAECVSRALVLLAPRLRQGEVEVLAPKPEGLLVAGDPGRLEQVFVNLLANAIDALANAALRRVEITIGREAENVIIRVHDSGPGLPAAALERAFEPFFTTKGVGEGLGLGLSISYGIIRDMGGSIRAENAAEGGAVFVITLPEGASSDPAVVAGD